jgi:DtxR family transcriptional regulator, Mn-dependent transcriptional regulator
VLSRSAEDYLKAIFDGQEASGAASTTDVARSLRVSPASVTGMIKRLGAAGLVQHVPYRGASLTATGRRAALRVVRRHRVLETYLAAKLGYGWDSVHAEAERLEHAVSDELVERMAMALGDPRYDPHGTPIPTASGQVESLQGTPLSEVPPGEVAQVLWVSGRDAELLRYVASLGLRPGVRCEVAARQPFRGPVTIRVLGPPVREHVLGGELAAGLLCEVVPREAG